MSLGRSRRTVPPKWEDPRYLEAFDRVLEVADYHGKPAEMFANIDNISWAHEKGFRCNTVGDADSFQMHGAKVALGWVRGG